VATTTSLLVRSSAMSVVTVAGPPVAPGWTTAPGPPGGAPGGWGPGAGVGVTDSPGRAPGRLALASKSFWMVVARSFAFAYLTWMTRISSELERLSSCSMIRSSRCMFEPMSLTISVSGWKGMVSPFWLTSC
jgi:hypothetical protein